MCSRKSNAEGSHRSGKENGKPLSVSAGKTRSDKRSRFSSKFLPSYSEKLTNDAASPSLLRLIPSFHFPHDAVKGVLLSGVVLEGVLKSARNALSDFLEYPILCVPSPVSRQRKAVANRSHRSEGSEHESHHSCFRFRVVAAAAHLAK